MLRKLLIPVKAIRFEHTAFVLSFGLAATFVAANGWPRGHTLAWILIAVAGAGITARAFNRIAGLDLEPKNPRTRDRALVTGAVTIRQLWAALTISAAAYFLAAAMLNRLVLALSPLVLALVLGYSYTKRFTVWTHWILGACLGMAPLGAWIGVRARMELPALVLVAAVTTWAAGFDIVSACQDVTFDRQEGLFSLPARWGTRYALVVSTANHVLTVWLLALFGRVAGLDWLYYAGVVALIPVLWYEHHVVRPDDLRRAEAASFVANGVFSIVLFLFAAADVILISSKMRI